MDSKSKAIIKETIKYLLELRYILAYEEVERQKKQWGKERIKIFVEDILNSMDYISGNFGDRENIIYGLDLSRLEEIDDKLIKLNSLLSISEPTTRILTIEKKVKVKEIVKEAEQMKIIEAKSFINVKEFAKKYGISANSQSGYRGRLYEKLPYHQKTRGGTILYNVEEVEKWLSNQHK